MRNLRTWAVAALASSLLLTAAGCGDSTPPPSNFPTKGQPPPAPGGMAKPPVKGTPRMP